MLLAVGLLPNYDGGHRAIRHPWMEEIDPAWRFQLFEFGGDKYHPETNSARDNLMDWTSTPTNGKSTRRIIILENVDPRIAELLGIRLEIPPEFFLAHCDEFSNIFVVDSACATNVNSYWRVQVPQARSIPKDFDRSPDIWYMESGNYDRKSVVVSQNTKTLFFYSQVSCWISKHDQYSWTGSVSLCLVFYFFDGTAINRKSNHTC